MISPTGRPFTRPTAAIRSIRPGKKYFCDCSQYCKSQQTEVHRSTYQRHAPVRQADLEKRLAHYRRDKSSTSVGPSLASLEGGSTKKDSGTQESQTDMMENRDSEPQVRHAAHIYNFLNLSLVLSWAPRCQ